MDDFSHSYCPTVTLRKGEKELNFSVEDMLVSLVMNVTGMYRTAQ